VVAGLFERARWEDGRNAHAAGDDNHFAVVFDFGGMSQRTDYIFKVVLLPSTPFTGFADFLKDNGDCSFFGIKIGNGERCAAGHPCGHDELPAFALCYHGASRTISLTVSLKTSFRRILYMGVRFPCA
jgi:hypothetical protein